MEEIIRAVREHNAALNSLMRAEKELSIVLEKSTVIVLHKLPGEITDSYWSYQKLPHEDFVRRGTKDIKRQAIIIEAPGPGEEFLPRLP